MTKEITDPKVIKPPQAMLFRLDLNLNVTEVSNNFYKLLGYTKKETIGNSILSTVHKDDRSKIKSIIDSLLTKHTQIATYEARKIKKDNSEIWVRAFIQILEPVKNKKEILITCEDITADIKNSERVKKLHECFLNFGSDADKNIDIIIKAISDLFDASCATYVKKNNKILCACSHLKYYCKNNKNNLLKSNFYKKVIRSSPPKVIYIKDLQKSILDKNDEIVVDNMLKSFLGKAISLNNQNIGALCIMFQNTFIPNEDDLKFLEILVSAISVEETRFKSQLTIIENEKRFRSLLENSTIGIFRTTPNGKVIFANSKLVNLLGYSSLEELTQIDVPKKIYANPNSRKKIKNILEKEDSIKDYLEIFKKKDGTLIHVKENARVIRDEKTNKVLFYEGTLEDITTQKRFETALINSEERFRSIFTNSGSGIVITNNKNYFIEANPKFCELLGYTKDELLKMTFFDITYPDDIKKSKKVITELHKGIKKNIHVQKRYVRKDGKIIWGSITVGFYSSELNNEYNQVGIFEDITESVTNLLKLNARDKILSALSFSTETFLKTLDWHANINEVLKRLGESLEASRCYIFQNHVSKSKEILTSQKYEWVAKNISPEINNPIMQNMSFKKIGLSELLVALKANKIFTKLTKDFNPKAKQFFEAQNIKSVLLVPIFESDKPWGFIGFDDCVNERIWSKQETEALSTAGNLFGVAIKRKIFEEELLKAKINAEEATELKSQFLAQISHEIRSPINSILSFTNLLKEDIKEKVDDELKSSFEIIESAGKRITRTIDLILNMSEVQTGTYDYVARKIDIYKDILLVLTKEFKGISETKGIKFKLIKKTDDTVRVLDAYTVMQVFVNLLDNAFKYTPKGKIQIVIKNNLKGKLEVSIADTGIGMAAKYIPKLFRPFSQEEQGYTRKFEGNGLGLALVKNYCDMNNAAISVKSKKNVGTTFTVTFN